MAKSKAKKSESKVSSSSKEHASDTDRYKELQRKAAGNTLHGQQAAYYKHRMNAGVSVNAVTENDFVVEG